MKKAKFLFAIILSIAILATLVSFQAASVAGVLYSVVGATGDTISPTSDIQTMFAPFGVQGITKNSSGSGDWAQLNAERKSIVSSATGLEFWVYVPTGTVTDKVVIVFGLNDGYSSDWGNDWYYRNVTITRGVIQKVSVPFTNIKNQYGGGTAITAAQVATAGIQLRVHSDSAGKVEGYFSEVYDIGELPPLNDSSVTLATTAATTVAATTAAPTTVVETTTDDIEITTNDIETTTDDIETTTEFVLEKGDINGDGKVNGMDLLLMKQHILDVPGKKIEEGTDAFWAADMNDDDKINGMDLLLLKKEILK